MVHFYLQNTIATKLARGQSPSELAFTSWSLIFDHSPIFIVIITTTTRLSACSWNPPGISACQKHFRLSWTVLPCAVCGLYQLFQTRSSPALYTHIPAGVPWEPSERQNPEPLLWTHWIWICILTRSSDDLSEHWSLRSTDVYWWTSTQAEVQNHFESRLLVTYSLNNIYMW